MFDIGKKRVMNAQLYGRAKIISFFFAKDQFGHLKEEFG